MDNLPSTHIPIYNLFSDTGIIQLDVRPATVIMGGKTYDTHATISLNFAGMPDIRVDASFEVQNHHRLPEFPEITLTVDDFPQLTRRCAINQDACREGIIAVRSQWDNISIPRFNDTPLRFAHVYAFGVKGLFASSQESDGEPEGPYINFQIDQIKVSMINLLLFNKQKHRCTDPAEQLHLTPTHTITLECPQPICLRTPELEHNIKLLWIMLSFLNGSKVSLPLYAAWASFEKYQQQVTPEISCWETPHYNSAIPLNWFSAHPCPNEEILDIITRGILQLINGQKANIDEISAIVFLYCAANTNRDAMVTIILSQTAMEHLYRVISKQPDKSGKKANNPKHASDKLRRVFSEFSIPTEVSEHCEQIKWCIKQSPGLNIEDGAHWLTEVRNHFTHAKPKSNLNLSYDAMCETRKYSLWCLELGLLGIFGYNGEYYNRLVPNYEKRLQLVPWSKKRSE